MKRMEAPSMQVKCGVENCSYNKNRSCHAEALEGNSMGDGIVKTSDGTACTTFENS